FGAMYQLTQQRAFPSAGYAGQNQRLTCGTAIGEQLFQDCELMSTADQPRGRREGIGACRADTLWRQRHLWRLQLHVLGTRTLPVGGGDERRQLARGQS